MAKFVDVGKRTINLEQVTEIRWQDQDLDGRPRVKVYFPGGDGNSRDYTTFSPAEGSALRELVLAASMGTAVGA